MDIRVLIRMDLHHSGCRVYRKSAEQLILLFSGNPCKEVGSHREIEAKQNGKQFVRVPLREKCWRLVARRERHKGGAVTDSI